jgi:hypothetical protein
MSGSDLVWSDRAESTARQRFDCAVDPTKAVGEQSSAEAHSIARSGMGGRSGITS